MKPDNMSFLQAIWWSSLFLAGLSVVMMTGLILRRVKILRAEELWKSRKDELTGLMLECLDGPDSAVEMFGIRDSRDVRLINEIAVDLSGSVRGETRQRLLGMLEEAGCRKAALAQLNARQERLRIQAVETLALFDGEDVMQALSAALDDPSAYVSFAALKALVDNGVEIPIPELIGKLDIGIKVKARGLREVFRKLALNSMPEFIEIAASDRPEAVRLLAIDALGAANDFSVVPLLAGLIDSDLLNIRAESLRALTAIGHPDAMEAVLKGLGDEAWEVRVQAAICAGRIGLAGAMPLLAGLLEDGEWWVRYRAANALKQTGQDGVNTLVDISKGQSRAAQTAQMVLFEENPL